MPTAAPALIAGSTLLSGALQSRAAGKAAGQQAAAAEAGIEEQRRQFDRLQELLSPYVQAGTPALQAQQALIGLGGAEAQQQAVSQLEASPLFQALARQGEEAMLQQASATGGLRGGNIQAALAQFRPQMLSQAIEEQYGRLGGLTALGQQSAAGVGAAGMQTGQAVAGLLGQQGAARAGGTLGRAAPFANLFNMPMQLAGMQYGMTGGGPFGSLFGGAPGAGTITSGSGLGGTTGSSGMYGAPSGLTLSDRRLKRDIQRLSTRKDGLNVYSFRYLWSNTPNIGLMAQEVQSVYPHAVVEMGGFLAVNYSAVPGG